MAEEPVSPDVHDEIQIVAALSNLSGGEISLRPEQQLLVVANAKRLHRFANHKVREQERKESTIPSQHVTNNVQDQSTRNELPISTTRSVELQPQPLVSENVKATLPIHSGGTTDRASTHVPGSSMEKAAKALIHDNAPAVAATAIALRADYPKLPKDTSKCPYCDIPLRFEAGDMRQWKKHASEDLQPYIKTKDLFAMKTLIARANLTERQQREEFNKEVNMLNRFAHLRHNHIVRLLASWTGPRNSIREHCLLFPLARYDLDLYWEKNSIEDTNIRWVAKQVLGMADALKSIHDSPSEFLQPQRQYGRHGNLTPENILWYDSSHDELGILVIADLGESAVDSAGNQSFVDIPRITPRYKAPEYDIEGGVISRASDIWSFGCVLLEFVCWCLEGQNGRQAFDSERYAPYPTGVMTDMFFDSRPTRDGTYVVLVKEAVTQVSARFDDGIVANVDPENCIPSSS
ncbi:hypothetical protein E8E13_007329 [Curvularia kusanoi]|uniref:Protein kinase domain-containing protein n=1 Tax=Curvularia kusanoi TaxID=90978 RepID=A0A9P4TJT8_CURKU|nr:hypothetical protein E8E13_007329 [Curvularia kusanoi]